MIPRVYLPFELPKLFRRGFQKLFLEFYVNFKKRKTYQAKQTLKYYLIYIYYYYTFLYYFIIIVFKYYFNIFLLYYFIYYYIISRIIVEFLRMNIVVKITELIFQIYNLVIYYQKFIFKYFCWCNCSFLKNSSTEKIDIKSIFLQFSDSVSSKYFRKQSFLHITNIYIQRKKSVSSLFANALWISTDYDKYKEHSTYAYTIVNIHTKYNFRN